MESRNTSPVLSPEITRLNIIFTDFGAYKSLNWWRWRLTLCTNDENIIVIPISDKNWANEIISVLQSQFFELQTLISVIHKMIHATSNAYLKSLVEKIENQSVSVTQPLIHYASELETINERAQLAYFCKPILETYVYKYPNIAKLVNETPQLLQSLSINVQKDLRNDKVEQGSLKRRRKGKEKEDDFSFDEVEEDVSYISKMEKQDLIVNMDNRGKQFWGAEPYQYFAYNRRMQMDHLIPDEISHLKNPGDAFSHTTYANLYHLARLYPRITQFILSSEDDAYLLKKFTNQFGLKAVNTLIHNHLNKHVEISISILTNSYLQIMLNPKLITTAWEIFFQAGEKNIIDEIEWLYILSQIEPVSTSIERLRQRILAFSLPAGCSYNDYYHYHEVIRKIILKYPDLKNDIFSNKDLNNILSAHEAFVEWQASLFSSASLAPSSCKPTTESVDENTFLQQLAEQCRLEEQAKKEEEALQESMQQFYKKCEEDKVMAQSKEVADENQDFFSDFPISDEESNEEAPDADYSEDEDENEAEAMTMSETVKEENKFNLFYHQPFIGDPLREAVVSLDLTGDVNIRFTNDAKARAFNLLLADKGITKKQKLNFILTIEQYNLMMGDENAYDALLNVNLTGASVNQ